MQELTDHFGKPIAAAYDEATAARSTPAVVDPVVDFLVGLTGGGRALELGVGTGRIALPLAERGVEVHGIELHAAHSMRKGIHDLAIRELRATPRSPVDIPEVLLSGDVQLDGVLRYVDGLPTHGFDAYLVADARVGWQVTSAVELELVGRNLFDSRHPEFQAFFINSVPTLTQSEMYVRLHWHLPKE